MNRISTILITGASSGLGAALALAYAAPGVTLGLLGRDTARLESVAAAARAKGAEVKSGICDIRDAKAVAEWIHGFDGINPIDLLIANAGVSAGLGEFGETEEQVRKIFGTNVDGVINTVLPVLPLMQKRGGGQVAIISSLAGIRGIPSCPAYSGSKVAVRAWGEALRGNLKSHGIKVCVVCPGYIRTPMTDVNTFPMPFIMSAEKAAGIIVRGLRKNKTRIAFPLALYIPLWLISCLPAFITDPLFAALPKKTTKENT